MSSNILLYFYFIFSLAELAKFNLQTIKSQDSAHEIELLFLVKIKSQPKTKKRQIKAKKFQLKKRLRNIPNFLGAAHLDPRATAQYMDEF